jgi:hypothetical protein
MQPYEKTLRFLLVSILFISTIIPATALPAQAEKFYINKATKEYADGDLEQFFHTCKAWKNEHPGFSPSFNIAYALYRLGKGEQAKIHISEIESKITMSAQQLEKLSLLKKEISYLPVAVIEKREGHIVLKNPNSFCYDECTKATKEEIAKDKKSEKLLRSKSNWHPIGMLSEPDALDISAKQ